MKQITKRDYCVLQFVLAELARMKSVGGDDGNFRGMSVKYRTHIDDPTKVTALVRTPGWEEYPHEVVLQQQGDDWIVLEAWFYDGLGKQSVTYENGQLVLGQPEFRPEWR